MEAEGDMTTFEEKMFQIRFVPQPTLQSPHVLWNLSLGSSGVFVPFTFFHVFLEKKIGLCALGFARVLRSTETMLTLMESSTFLGCRCFFPPNNYTLQCFECLVYRSCHVREYTTGKRVELFTFRHHVVEVAEVEVHVFFDEPCGVHLWLHIVFRGFCTLRTRSGSEPREPSFVVHLSCLAALRIIWEALTQNRSAQSKTIVGYPNCESSSVDRFALLTGFVPCLDAVTTFYIGLSLSCFLFGSCGVFRHSTMCPPWRLRRMLPPSVAFCSGRRM